MWSEKRDCRRAFLTCQLCSDGDWKACVYPGRVRGLTDSWTDHVTGGGNIRTAAPGLVYQTRRTMLHCTALCVEHRQQISETFHGVCAERLWCRRIFLFFYVRWSHVRPGVAPGRNHQTSKYEVL